jgi:hypothetical protein
MALRYNFFPGVSMTVINYALEIYLNNITLTDFPHGLVNGVFRFVTGRPHYDGVTVVPTYGLDEINKNGFPVGGDNVPYAYFQDFIIKDGLDGNATRAVDIIPSGSYGNQSTFSFKLRGDAIDSTYFWQFCGDNQIVLTNSLVIHYAVIDGVFWQLYRGKVSNNPYTETEFSFECVDESATIHKTIPPYLDTIITTSIAGTDTVVSSISNSNVNSISGDELQPNQTSKQVTIPVAFGDISYSPVTKTNDQNQFVILNIDSNGRESTSAPASKITVIYNTVTPNPGGVVIAPLIQSCQVELVTNGVAFVANDPRLVGCYLQVVSGEKADTDTIYKIISNTASTVIWNVGSNWIHRQVTVITIDNVFTDTNKNLVLDADFNSTDAQKDLYSYYYGSLPHASANTWWFRISTFTVDTEISTLNYLDAPTGAANVQKNSGGNYNIYTWDTTSNTYIDLSSMLNVGSNFSSIVLTCNTATKDGKISIVENIGLPIKYFGLRQGPLYPINPQDGPYYLESRYTNTWHTTDADIATVTDKDRTTMVAMGAPLAGMSNVYFCTGFQMSPLLYQYSRIFYLADFYVSGSVNYYQLGPLNYVIFDYNGLMIDLNANGNFTKTNVVKKTDTGATLPYTLNHNSWSPSNFNLIPNYYYNAVPNTDNISLFSMPIGSAPQTGVETIPYCLFLDFSNGSTVSIADLTPASDYYDTIECAMGLIALNWGNQTPTNWVNGLLSVKQILLMGVRSVDTISGDLFAKVQGELTGYGPNNPTHSSTDLGKPTNDLYHTIMHILEDYDGIPKRLINYGAGATGLLSARGPSSDPTVPPIWAIGRTLTDQQSSQNYLNEICSQSFVCMFGNRKGQREFNAWLGGPHSPNTVYLPPTSGNGKTPYHNSNLIIDGTVSSLGKTDFTQVYNAFQLKYNYDAGSKSYTRYFNVQNIDQAHVGSSFPLEANPDWHNYVTGLSTQDWFQAANVWYQCILSYQRNAVNQLATTQISELPWFLDESIYQGNSTLDPTASAAWAFLQFLTYWTTRQKDIVTYNIPINENTAGTELLDCIQFRDDVFTGGDDRTGWITSIEVDATNNQFILQVTLQSVDMAEDSGALSDSLDERPNISAYIDSLDERTTSTDSLREY